MSEKKQFIYFLKLVPELLNLDKWTEKENDPAVKEGIMTAELFPYRAALVRNIGN